MKRHALRLTQGFVLAVCLVCAFIPAAATAEDDFTAPERRRDQFPKDFGYAAFPYPYRLPGIGSGLSLAAGAFNIADTYTDAYGIVFAGDVKGGAAGVGDIHLVPRTLILDLGYSAISKAAFQSYAQRGMNTRKDDFRLLEVGDTEYYGARMTATFLDRRVELHGAWYEGASRLKTIRDKEGNVIGRPISMLNQLGVRFRDVRQGPDGFLYVLTEMRNAGNDDTDGAVLRIEPAEPE